MVVRWQRVVQCHMPTATQRRTHAACPLRYRALAATMHSMPVPIALPAALGHDRSDRRIAVLREIAATGSISQAARVVGISYKAAWQAVETLTTLAGTALVERVVGGAGGGGAVLTPAGLDLLAAAHATAQARGAVLGRWPGQSQAHQTGALSRLALQTSMRNHLPCVVRHVQVEGAIARVFLDFFLPSEPTPAPEHAPLVARITRESAQLLALAPGVALQALCKATAVQVARCDATALERLAPAAECVLTARATRVVRGAQGDEVTAQLHSAGRPTGLHMVGFAAAHSRLRAGSWVQLRVEENALVLALAGD